MRQGSEELPWGWCAWWWSTGSRLRRPPPQPPQLLSCDLTTISVLGEERQQLLPRAAGGTSARKQQLQLHRSRWKNIINSRHKTVPALPSFERFPASSSSWEQHAQLKKKITTRERQTSVVTQCTLQQQHGIAMTTPLISTCQAVSLQSIFVGIKEEEDCILHSFISCFSSGSRTRLGKPVVWARGNSLKLK